MSGWLTRALPLPPVATAEGAPRPLPERAAGPTPVGSKPTSYRRTADPRGPDPGQTR
ncbi:protein of unknown function [Streptantibioticus cattleyicolor NRRL 8057 = DSM 46488]|nr:protein of unknown function [Streptantibioticus cattleyicolor NRRL 8057 = DSM 46488]